MTTTENEIQQLSPDFVYDSKDHKSTQNEDEIKLLHNEAVGFVYRMQTMHFV